MTWVWQVLLLAVLYFVAGRLGLSLTHYHDNATLVWPPTGLSLAALLLFVIAHIVLVVMTGFRKQLRAMTWGK